MLYGGKGRKGGVESRGREEGEIGSDKDMRRNMKRHVSRKVEGVRPRARGLRLRGVLTSGVKQTT